MTHFETQTSPFAVSLPSHLRRWYNSRAHPFLRRAFERSNKDEQCPQVVAPTQEGVKALVLMDKKSYQLALMRALATTDDPYLLKWFVVNQDDIDPMASRLLYKYYKALEKKREVWNA